MPVWDTKNQSRVQKTASVLEVEMTEPDSLGNIDIVFSDSISLQADAVDWSSENEGADLIEIEIQLSDTTKGLLYEENVQSIGLTWKVSEV